MERTLLLVKPDGVCQKRIGAVILHLEQAGLAVRGMKMTKLDRSRAEAFYRDHLGKPFFEGLLGFMTSAPIVAMVLEGHQAVSLVRQLIGSTNSTEAAPGTLRRQFGHDQRYNLVHASDSVGSADREIPFFFSTEEMYTYEAADWKAASK